MKRSTNGLTLIELLIVVAILGIMATVMYDMMVQPTYVWHTETTREVMRGDYSNLMRMLGRDLRCAQGILAKAGEMESGMKSLVLETTLFESGVSGVQPARVHYYIEKGSHEEPAKTLWRDLYRLQEGDWTRVSHYPLSRENDNVRFAPAGVSWSEAKGVLITIDYSKCAVHEDLKLSATRVIALRGRRAP